MRLTPTGEHPSQLGPAEWFTGTVWLDEIAEARAPSHLRSHVVNFQPGARTAWHEHPVGQVLHVVSGVGRVQCADEAVREVRAGDSVWFAPGERHWHGAAPDRVFAHIAIQETGSDGTAATWGAHVTDEEYLADPVPGAHERYG